jgi:hypothetical protein
MTIYTQEINDIVEPLPESDQRFIVDLIKISINHLNGVKKRNTSREARRKFINDINAITDEPLDDEFFEIVNDRINISRELNL